jgi:hypothetical protein
MPIGIADLVAYLRGDDTQLEKDLDDAKGKTEKAGLDMASVFKG